MSVNKLDMNKKSGMGAILKILSTILLLCVVSFGVYYALSSGFTGNPAGEEDASEDGGSTDGTEEGADSSDGYMYYPWEDDPAAAAIEQGLLAVTSDGQVYDTTRPVAYLTFDDGPSANTESILNTLDEYGVKATFFINGKLGPKSEARMIEIVERGHRLANHTFSHSYADIYSSVDAFLSDIDKLSSYVQRVTGQTMEVFRFPGGSINCRKYSNKNHLGDAIFDALYRRGYSYFDWNSSADDAVSKPIPADKIVENVMAAHPKDPLIILMHDSPTAVHTPEAVGPIIKQLTELGYQFLTLSNDSVAVQHYKYTPSEVAVGTPDTEVYEDEVSPPVSGGDGGDDIPVSTGYPEEEDEVSIVVPNEGEDFVPDGESGEPEGFPEGTPDANGSGEDG